MSVCPSLQRRSSLWCSLVWYLSREHRQPVGVRANDVDGKDAVRRHVILTEIHEALVGGRDI